MLRRRVSSPIIVPNPSSPSSFLFSMSALSMPLRYIISGPSSGSFGGVHEQKVKAGLSGELKRGFKREIVENKEKLIREQLAREKLEQEEAGIRKELREAKVNYSKDEERAEATKREREQKGGMFLEEADEVEYHVDKRFEATGRTAPSVERDQAAQIGGYHHDPETGETRNISDTEARRIFRENEQAEMRRAEDREHMRQKMEDRYRAYAKREPGKPLPGSKIEQQQKEKELGDFLMDNPDIAVGRTTVWVASAVMVAIMVGLSWGRDKENPIWDGAQYPEWSHNGQKEQFEQGKFDLDAKPVGPKRYGVTAGTQSEDEIAAAAVTFRQIAGAEKDDSFVFHTAHHEPPRRFDNYIFPERRKTPLP